MKRWSWLLLAALAAAPAVADDKKKEDKKAKGAPVAQAPVAPAPVAQAHPPPAPAQAPCQRLADDEPDDGNRERRGDRGTERLIGVPIARAGSIVAQ